MKKSSFKKKILIASVSCGLFVQSVFLSPLDNVWAEEVIEVDADSIEIDDTQIDVDNHDFIVPENGIEVINDEEQIELEVPAEAKPGFSKHYYSFNGRPLAYWLYVPETVDRQTPLIVYLHDSASQGEDLDVLLEDDGLPYYIYSGQITDVKAYIVIPLLPEEHPGWDRVRNELIQLTKDLRTEYGIKNNKIGITGIGLGGTGTWRYLLNNTSSFACGLPVSGQIGFSDKNLKRLSTVPIWAILGANDTVIPPDSIYNIIAGLNIIDGSAKMSVFDGAGYYDLPRIAYIDNHALDWLIARCRGEVETPTVITDYFDDLDKDAWYINAITYVVDRYIMVGMGDRVFAPNATCTRAMAVTVLHSLMGKPEITEVPPFTDLPSAWYRPAVAWAYDANITVGKAKGRFCPGERVSREQMAVFLFNFAQYLGYSVTARSNITGYIDNTKVSNWSLKQVEWAVKQGILTGKSYNTLDPQGATTRAEMAQMIYRFIKVHSGEGNK